MKSVILTITNTVERDLPQDRSFAGFRFRLVAPSGAQAEDTVPDLTLTFAAVPPGVYAASVVPVDAQGVPLDDGVTIQVTVPADSGARLYRSPAGLAAEIV